MEDSAPETSALCPSLSPFLSSFPYFPFSSVPSLTVFIIHSTTKHDFSPVAKITFIKPKRKVRGQNKTFWLNLPIRTGYTNEA